MNPPVRPLGWVALVLGLCVLAAACLEEGAVTGEGELAGMTVEVMGAFVEPANAAFLEAVEDFEEDTGATVSYEGSADFETLILTRVEGGNPPDIAMFPQPGLMADFVADLRPLDDVVDTEALQASLLPGLFELGTVDGAYYGLPRVIAVKSVVWYPPGPFADAGYEVPETWQELLDLSEAIAQDSEPGQAPWCIGVESSGATGWVITDWIEDLMLRTAGPEAYDAWVSGELPFSSPEVRRAAEMFADIALTEGYVLGGRDTILTTPFGAAPLPMFEEPPGCYLHRQASFIIGFLPDDVEPGEDVDVFYFPPVEDGYEGSPLLGSGDLASLFTDNPAAEELMRYMSDPQWLGPQVDTGADFSPHKDFPVEEYPNEVTREQASILAEADVFRFDASDSMPGAVGTGAFWSQMVSWVNGDITLDQALQNIDDAWPNR